MVRKDCFICILTINNGLIQKLNFIQKFDLNFLKYTLIKVVLSNNILSARNYVKCSKTKDYLRSFQK